ncbi:MAG: F-box protein [Chlamydiales bacterium]|nr:F-box protein [Chlamydiales bacterium]
MNKVDFGAELPQEVMWHVFHHLWDGGSEEGVKALVRCMAVSRGWHYSILSGEYPFDPFVKLRRWTLLEPNLSPRISLPSYIPRPSQIIEVQGALAVQNQAGGVYVLNSDPLFLGSGKAASLEEKYICMSDSLHNCIIFDHSGKQVRKWERRPAIVIEERLFFFEEQRLTLVSNLKEQVVAENAAEFTVHDNFLAVRCGLEGTDLALINLKENRQIFAAEDVGNYCLYGDGGVAYEQGGQIVSNDGLSIEIKGLQRLLFANDDYVIMGNGGRDPAFSILARNCGHTHHNNKPEDWLTAWLKCHTSLGRQTAEGLKFVDATIRVFETHLILHHTTTQNEKVQAQTAILNMRTKQFHVILAQNSKPPVIDEENSLLFVSAASNDIFIIHLKSDRILNAFTMNGPTFFHGKRLVYVENRKHLAFPFESTPATSEPVEQ